MWRYTFDPVSHQLLGADVGEGNEEEIDIVTKGKNFGWPIKEGNGKGDLSDSNNTSIFTSPICTYSHKTGICVIGGSFYYGEGIPSLKNKYVFADFNGSLHSLVKNDAGTWIRQPIKLILLRLILGTLPAGLHSIATMIRRFPMFKKIGRAHV